MLLYFNLLHTDFSMNLVLENVMKIENFQIFYCMQSFHDVQSVSSYCDGNEFLAHFHRTAYMKLEWETAYKQAPKTGLKQKIFHKEKRERELDNIQFLRRCPSPLCDGNEFFAHFHRTAYIKLERDTEYKQAPKTGLKQNISQEKERERAW